MGNQKQSLTPPRSLTPLRLRFGPVEDRRNNHRLVTVACVVWSLQIWWLSPFTRSPDPIGIASLTFTPDGKKFASAGFDRTLKLWDVATGEELLRFEGFSGTVCQPRFSRDGWALSALDLGGTVARPEVFLWRTTENEPPTPGLGQSTKPTP